MKTFTLICTVCITLMIAAGCSSSKINVEGDKADLNSIVGKWEGSYKNPRTGRSGTISFNLKAGQDSATGDVIMMPPGSQEQYQPAVNPGTSADPVPLKIKFVAVSGDVIRGNLEPYFDPTCSCTLETSFEGTIDVNTVEGTFFTRSKETGESSRGQWKVKKISR